MHKGRKSAREHWIFAILCVWAVTMAVFLCCLLLALARRIRAEKQAEAERTSDTGIETELRSESGSEEYGADREMAAVWTGERPEAKGDARPQTATDQPEDDVPLPEDIYEQTTADLPEDEPEEPSISEMQGEPLTEMPAPEPQGDQLTAMSASESQEDLVTGPSEAEAAAASLIPGQRSGLAGWISERLGRLLSAGGAASSGDASLMSETAGATGAEGQIVDGSGTVSTSVKNMLIDLDYNSDVDDVCALAVAAELHLEGRIRLLGITLSTSGEDPVKAAHAQLRYYGLGSIPVGRASVEVTNGSPYWRDLINAWYDGSDLVELDAVELLKEKLRECAAAGVRARIATTGYLTNIAALLEDAEGYALVRDHVEDIYITGGIWLQGGDHNFVWQQPCVDAAVYVQAHAPVPLVYSSSMSVHNDSDEWMMVGRRMLERDTAGSNPVTVAFRGYERDNEVSLADGRFAWDPMCVFVAALGESETMTHLEPCHMYIHAEDGTNVFSPERADQNCLVIHRDTEDLGWYQWMIEDILDATLR